MEDLRESMYRAIELYGLLDPKTIYISEQLDKLVVKEQKENARRYN